MFYGFNEHGEYIFSSPVYVNHTDSTKIIESNRYYETSRIKLVNGEIVELELDADNFEPEEESIALDPVLVLESIISMQNQLDEISKSKE